MRGRIFFKLVAAFVLVIAAATATIDIGVRRSWEASLRDEIDLSLRQKTLMFAERIQSEPNPRCRKPPRKLRPPPALVSLSFAAMESSLPIRKRIRTPWRIMLTRP